MWNEQIVGKQTKNPIKPPQKNSLHSHEAVETNTLEFLSSPEVVNQGIAVFDTSGFLSDIDANNTETVADTAETEPISCKHKNLYFATQGTSHGSLSQYGPKYKY